MAQGVKEYAAKSVKWQMRSVVICACTSERKVEVKEYAAKELW